MEEIKLSIQQAQNAFRKSRNTIYYWTNTGKVKYEDSETGRILILTKEEYERLLKLYNPYYNIESNVEYNIEQDNTIEHNIEYKAINNFGSKKAAPELQGIIDSFLTRIEDLTTQLVDYSEKAGQVKLLTDNNKFYQDEYFKLKYELENLTKLNQSETDKIKDLELKVNELYKENSDLKARLSKYETKWWNKSLFK